MPRVAFTPNLARFGDVTPIDVDAATVVEALDAAFAERPALRHYVLDEQRRLRRHLVVFVAGAPVKDRVELSDPVAPADEVYVFQALSGG